MATSNGFIHSNRPAPPPSLLPPWLSISNHQPTPIPPAPSVDLTLSPSPLCPPTLWSHSERLADNNSQAPNLQHGALAVTSMDLSTISELTECCRELEEGHRAWLAHKKETAWRLRRVELQLESEKATRRREKIEEIEIKIRALKEEQKTMLERIEAEYKEQLLGLRRDAEAKEQKLAEQWASKHARVARFLEQIRCDPAGRS